MNDSQYVTPQWLSDHNNVQTLVPSEISLHSLIQAGGQGAVFLGTFDGAPAAIKIYFPGQLSTRVDREVDALRILQCESIVKLFWYGYVEAGEDSLPIVVTEYIEGLSLESRLKQSPLEEDELCRLAYDVTSAIDCMWDLRIVHRDLKPANILCRPSGRFCVIDLGVARHLEMSSLTAMGLTWGTYGYLSPEQTRSVRQLTCKSDIFALGVVLLEAGLGRHPTQRDQLRLLARGFHKKLPEPIESMGICSLIKSFLDPRPTRRPKALYTLNNLEVFST